jgi:hypothetical protein
MNVRVFGRSACARWAFGPRYLLSHSVGALTQEFAWTIIITLLAGCELSSGHARQSASAIAPSYPSNMLLGQA